MTTTTAHNRKCNYCIPSNQKHRRMWRGIGSWPSRRGHMQVRQHRGNPAVDARNVLTPRDEGSVTSGQRPESDIRDMVTKGNPRRREDKSSPSLLTGETMSVDQLDIL